MFAPTWPASPAEVAPFASLHKALGGSFRDGRAVLGSSLRIKQLDPGETESYLWPDPATASAFRSGVNGQVWALAWVQGETIAPLVLIESGGALGKPRLLHLVPGLPAETLRT
jgi:hypothetical protein